MWEQTTSILWSQPAWAHVGEKQDRIEDHDKVTDKFGGRGISSAVPAAEPEETVGTGGP